MTADRRATAPTADRRAGAPVRFVPPVLTRTPTPGHAPGAADAPVAPPDPAIVAAFEEGRREGRAAAQAEIDAAVARHDAARAQLAASIAAFDAATADLQARTVETLRDLERQAVLLALGLAEAVIGHELLSMPRSLRLALARAARLVPERGELAVHVHPDAAADAAAAVPEVLGAVRSFRVVADPTVEPGGCVVRCGALEVDAQIGSALERMTALLAH